MPDLGGNEERSSRRIPRRLPRRASGDRRRCGGRSLPAGFWPAGKSAWWGLVLLALGCAGPVVASPAITVDEIMARIRFLASDAFEGRDTGGEGARRAAAYIGRELGLAGAVPAGDKGSYLQDFLFTAGAAVGSPNRLVVRAGQRQERIEGADDLMPLPLSASGKAAGPLAFVGYGISAPELAYDDYAGVDVRGKIVIALRHTPEGDDAGSRFHAYGPLRRKALVAAAKGACGILFVEGPREGPEDTLGAFPAHAAPANCGIPAAFLRRALAEALLRGAGETTASLEAAGTAGRAPQPFVVPNVLAELQTTVVRQQREAANVVGWLEGADPVRKREAIIIGAHYDHLGMGSAELRALNEPHAVYNGANDNASGVAGMLELAEFFGKQRPPCSLVFVSFAGEEIGLLGSTWAARHLPPQVGRVIAMINLDMIGRLEDDRLLVAGAGSSPVWKSLLAESAALYQLEVREDPCGFGTSDQWAFYERGIPVLFFFTGVPSDYHTPNDTWPLINGPGEQRILQSVASMVARLAGLPKRPQFVRVRPSGAAVASRETRVFVGMSEAAVEDPLGVQVASVADGSPAAVAGVRGGDLVIEVAGRRIRNSGDYAAAFGGARPEVPLNLRVMRGGRPVSLTLVPRRLIH